MAKATFNGVTGEVLNMTLQYKWFDRILSGKKHIEYREGKDYWHNRLIGHKYKFIRFSRGYTSVSFVIEFKGVKAMLIDNPFVNCEDPNEDKNYEKNYTEGTVALDADEFDRELVAEYQIKLGNIVSRCGC